MLTASNFAGFAGNFNEVGVDVPVFYQITASISGTGGVISPTPDAAGIISAQGGADFTVNFIADSGYKVSSIVVNGVSQPVASSFTFPSLAANQTFVVSLEPGVVVLQTGLQAKCMLVGIKWSTKVTSTKRNGGMGITNLIKVDHGNW